MSANAVRNLCNDELYTISHDAGGSGGVQYKPKATILKHQHTSFYIGSGRPED